jgi:hypothetical protein
MLTWDWVFGIWKLEGCDESSWLSFDFRHGPCRDPWPIRSRMLRVVAPF